MNPPYCTSKVVVCVNVFHVFKALFCPPPPPPFFPWGQSQLIFEVVVGMSVFINCTFSTAILLDHTS